MSDYKGNSNLVDDKCLRITASGMTMNELVQYQTVNVILK